MTDSIRVGVVQFAPMHKDVAANLSKMLSLIENADADLLVFPELSLSGYAFTSTKEATPYSLSDNDREINELLMAAKKSGIAIVFGYSEQSGEQLYNSSLAIDSTGNIAGKYRKVHLFYYEKEVFTPGDLGFPVFDLILKNGRRVKLGMEICYDWRFPEATRSLALQGVELIAIPSNIVTTTGMLHDTLRVRAFENKVIIAFADRMGSEILPTEKENEDLIFRGESAIINYNGEVLLKLPTNEESIGYSTIDLTQTRTKNINKHNNIVSDRRNKQYFQ
jgi:predicted amidohydrolase